MRPFALLTYSIIVLVIVGLAITLMIQFFPKEDVFTEIRNSIDISQTPSNFGKTFYTGKLSMTRDLQITKTSINKDNISLAVECNDPTICCSNGEECAKPVEWDYKIITFNQDKSVEVYTRCYPYFDEIVCRVYFGKMPAQAKIEDIEYVNDGGKISSIVKVTNSGSNTLVLGKNSLRVLKKVGEEWKNTENTYPPKEIDLLNPNQNHSFVWETELLTGGEYKLEFKFEGENSGYDINSFDLVVGSNQQCVRDESKTEVQDYNTTHIRTINFCTGCNYGYECLAKWIEKNDGKDYDVYEQNSVQYIRQMTDSESCDRELSEDTGYFSLQGNCIPGYVIIPVNNLTKGICCIKTIEAISNPCETAPDSTECVFTWLPQNQDYVCPFETDISAYSSSCTVNEWVNPIAIEYAPDSGNN